MSIKSFDTDIISDILSAKKSYEQTFHVMPTHMFINENKREDIKHFFNLIASPPQINYYDETDELNHRFHGMKIKFVEMQNSFILFDKSRISNPAEQQFLDDLELSYKRNAEEYRISVYSKIKENLKGKTVQLDALELFNLISFLDASSKLIDEGRLPYRKFEEGAFKIVERLEPLLDLDKKLYKSAPGLDYQIFDDMSKELTEE